MNPVNVITTVTQDRAERIAACVKCLNTIFGIKFSCPDGGAIILSIAEERLRASVNQRQVGDAKVFLQAGQALGMLQALRPAFCEIAPDVVAREMRGNTAEIEFTSVLELETTIMRLSQRTMFSDRLKQGAFDEVRTAYERFRPNPQPTKASAVTGR